jgi:hypothetical protein
MRHAGVADRCVVLLPGATYPTRAPLLWFARETALRRGWTVVEVLDEWRSGEDPRSWAVARCQAAITAARTDTIAIVGKSMASLASGVAVELALPAVWLTPLLDDDAVVADLERASAPRLLVGSPADPCWRPERLTRRTGMTVLELGALDHSFTADAGPAASLHALATVTAAVDAHLAAVVAQGPPAVVSSSRST